jgi:hypothetical protein
MLKVRMATTKIKRNINKIQHQNSKKQRVTDFRRGGDGGPGPEEERGSGVDRQKYDAM